MGAKILMNFNAFPNTSHLIADPTVLKRLFHYNREEISLRADCGVISDADVYVQIIII